MRSSMSAGRRSVLRLALAVALLLSTLTTLLTPSNALAQSNPPLVISQLYGAGGNSGATLQNDFVEIFNRGTSPVALTGLSVQYASATGTGNFSANPVVSLSGSLNPGQYYLVQLSGGTNGAALPTPDTTGTINASGSAGKFVLVNGTAGLACNGGSTPCSSAQLAQIIDLVGYGSANFFEGSAAAPALTATTAALRAGNGCTDTNNNSADFSSALPTPRNSASPLNSCGGPVNQPVVTNCPASLTTPVGTATSANLSASDVDGIVTSATITSASVPGITLGAVTPAAAVGGSATVTLDVAASVTAGSYAVAVQFSNNDSPAQTASCTLNVTVEAPVVTSRIHELQGARHIAPSVITVNNNSTSFGASVTTVGIVTVVRSNGFYIEEPTATRDSDPATSEGIFVFTGSAPTVTVGDQVRVAGTVQEFRPGCTSSSCSASSSAWNNLTSTQIGNPGRIITVLSSNNPLPEPIVIGSGGRSIPTQFFANAGQAPTNTIETTSYVFDPVANGVDFYESLEGMRVQINNAVVVGPTNAFGEIYVLGDNGAGQGTRSARNGLVITAEDQNPERIQLDDTLVALPQVNVGDSFSGPIIGVLDYNFANYEVLPSVAPTRVDNNLQAEVTTLTGAGGKLTIGNFNIENFDPKIESAALVGGAADIDDDLGPNNTGRVAQLAQIIVTNMAAPDILALQEVQDGDGAERTTVVSAADSYTALINAIVVAGGPTYQYRDISPVDDQDGGQPGGNIRVGFLFRTDRGLSFVDRAAPEGVNTSSTGVTVVNNNGTPELAFSPGRIDPSNSAFASSRKPLVGEFSINGEKLFVINNHFNSKGGDQPLAGRFQPATRNSEVQRHQQAQIVNDFVDSLLAVNANAAIVVLGDLNDFQFSETLNIVKGGATPVLFDPKLSKPISEQYTYIFEGNSQVLDSLLVSARLAPVTEYDTVSVNSEFADALKASDHDPSVARFTFGTPPSITFIPVSNATQGVNFSIDINASGDPTPTFSLVNPPPGMTIDPVTGLIRWNVLVIPGSYNITVRASNGIFPDDDETLTINVAASPRTRQISPVLECVRDNGPNVDPSVRYTALFGYSNPNRFPVEILVGPMNRFQPAPENRGQPTVFLPGRQRSVFEVPYNGSLLVWALNQRTATASTNPQQRCR
jgi:predicted extracellular nuclease